LLQFLLNLLRDADGDEKDDRGASCLESRGGLEEQEMRKTRDSSRRIKGGPKERHATKLGNSSDTKEDSNDNPEQDHNDDQDILSLAALQCLHLIIDAGKHHLANHLHTLLPPLLLHHLLLPTHTSTILLLLTTLSQHVELSLLLPPLLHLNAFTHPSPLVRAAALGVVCVGLTVMDNAASISVATRFSPQQLLALALEGAKEEEEEVREAGREAVRLVYRLFSSAEGEDTEEGREGGEGSFFAFVRTQGGEALEADVRGWLFVKKEVEEKKKEEEEDEQQQEHSQEEEEEEQERRAEQEAPPLSPPAASFFDRAKLVKFTRQISGRSLIPRPASSTQPDPSEAAGVPPASSLVTSASASSPSSSFPSPGSSPPPPPPPPPTPSSPTPRRRAPLSTPPRSPVRGKGLVQWDDDDEEADEEQWKEITNTTLVDSFSFPLPRSQQQQQQQQQRSLPRHRPISSPPRGPMQGESLVEWRDDEGENSDDEGGLAATALVAYSPPSPPSPQPPPPAFRSRLFRPSRASSSSSLNVAPSPPAPPPPLSPLLVEYLSPADIHPLPQPSHILPLLLESLPTADWPESFHALTTVRRFALRHPDILLALPPVQLQILLRQVLRQVNNLRSAVAKNALLALADLWAGLASSSLSSSSSSSRVPTPSKSSGTDITIQRLMEGELAAIAPVLLRRFCDTSGFLVEAAESALDAVILHTPDTTRVLLAFLSLASHKSSAGRSKVASLMLRCLLVLTSTAAASPSGAATAAGDSASPRKQGTKVPTPKTTTMTNRKKSGGGGGILSKDLRERLELATQQWLKDANGETRAEGRKVAGVLPFLV